MSKIALPEPVLYIPDDAAPELGLDPSQIVQPDYHNKYVFLRDKAAVSDIRAIQEEFKLKKRGSQEEINRPIITTGADGKTATLMVADNETEAEEVLDILGETLEKQENALRTQKRNVGNATPVIDTEWIRYVNDLPPAELFDRFFRQALEDRVELHKKNPRTDPARDPWAYARENGDIAPSIAVPSNYEVSNDAAE